MAIGGTDLAQQAFMATSCRERTKVSHAVGTSTLSVPQLLSLMQRDGPLSPWRELQQSSLLGAHTRQVAEAQSLISQDQTLYLFPELSGDSLIKTAWK